MTMIQETDTITTENHNPAYIRGIIKAESAKYTTRPFEVDEANKEALEAVCYYFANDPEFETMGQGWKLNKGLLICGPAGTGKTLLMKCLKQNPKRSFDLVPCRKISEAFVFEGRKGINDYTSPRLSNAIGRGEYSPASHFSHYSYGICYDDLGAECKGVHFSDIAEVMEQVILSLYDKRQSEYFQYSFFHITTNYTIDQIEARYGTRVRSRMREMFNLISLQGNDRRK